MHTFKEVHNCFIQNIPKLEKIICSASVKWLNKSLHSHTMAPDPAVRVSNYRHVQEPASFTDAKLNERSQTYDNSALVFRLDKGQQTSIPNRSVQSARLVIQYRHKEALSNEVSRTSVWREVPMSHTVSWVGGKYIDAHSQVHELFRVYLMDFSVDLISQDKSF